MDIDWGWLRVLPAAAAQERHCHGCGSTEHLISQCPLKEKKEGPGSGAEEEDETDS